MSFILVELDDCFSSSHDFDVLIPQIDI